MSFSEKAPINISGNPGAAFANEAPPYSEKISPAGGGNAFTSSGKADSMFKSNSWRDLWAAVLYYCHLAGVFVILGLNYTNLSKIEDPKTVESSQIFPSLGIFGVSLMAGLFLLVIFMSLINRYPASMIKATFIASIVMLAVMGVCMFFVPGGAFMGLVNLLLAGLNVIIYFAWRKRIPFSASLLKCVVDVMKIYPNTWNMSAFAILSQMAFIGLYMVSFASVGFKYSKLDVNNPSIEGGDLAAMLYLVFSMYWTFQVLENVVHTTVCGVFATFYFLHGTGAAVVSPVWNSFSRSMTYSFGSIAFGSLIVAVIQFIRFLINSTRNDRDNLAAACADCLIGMIEGLVRYFNYYAYVHVAIYGKPFVESGKDTWELIKSHGVDVIINDSLVGNCLSIAVFAIGLISAVIAFIGGKLFLGDNDAAIITVTIAAFVFVSMIVAVSTQLIESGVSATLVCYAEDPAALQRTKPELYREITSSYQQSFF